jgi:hypothetical protein
MGENVTIFSSQAKHTQAIILSPLLFLFSLSLLMQPFNQRDLATALTQALGIQIGRRAALGLKV